MKCQQKSVPVLAVIMVFFAVILIMTTLVQANNIQFANVYLVDQDRGADTINICFDLSWDNSWRLSATNPPGNRDAVWVFAKWKPQNGTNWSHCTLSTTDTGHTAPTGSEIDASFTKDNDGKGVFIYRSSTGFGSNSWSDVKLRWDYGTDGMSDNEIVEVRVFAIEMVYVPQGAFYLGDGISQYTLLDNDSSPNPAYISTAEVTVYATGSFPGGPIVVDGDDGVAGNADYPTGFKAFYCMKYEMSQGQYANFLNTLDRSQQNTRTGTDVSGDTITDVYVMSQSSTPSVRSTIRCPASGNGTTNPIVFTADVPDRACNFISWDDGAAYADWAGLRPMTELEFEKACRGPQSPVEGEFAWGNANIATSAYTLLNDGMPSEAIDTNYATDPIGNSLYGETSFYGDNINGPLRCGIFATASSSRAEAGASYYSVMEMSGNLLEHTVAINFGFTGAHGDGSLDATGDSDVSNWPNWPSVYPTGRVRRGGVWDGPERELRISDRAYFYSFWFDRLNKEGFRMVRTE